MGHFYDEKGILHDCDIKEARKNKWVSGTTEIIYEFDNSYGLDLYKQKQMFLSAMTMPRPEGITDEAFYDLVVEDSKQHSERAKQFGIDVHRIVTDILKNGSSLALLNEKTWNAAEKIIEWIKSNKENCIVDFKTQETKDGKFKHYDSWLFQLCGYKLGSYLLVKPPYNISEFIDYGFSTENFGGTIDYAKIECFENLKLINLIVSSNEDIPIKPYEWKPDKVKWGCKVFQQMVELYRTIKKL